MRAAALFFVAMLSLAAGCAPSATFVSTEPPPQVEVVADFTSSSTAVTSALRRAMIRSGITLEAAGPERNRVVGVRQQVPYVGGGAVDPAPGRLPFYSVTGVVTVDEQTRVRLTVDARCQTCDGSTPYEWEYPVDVLRAVLERTREALGEGRLRVEYPRRYKPAKWQPPREP
jgi:hypothetical protein